MRKFLLLTMLSVLVLPACNKADAASLCEALASDKTYQKDGSYKKLIEGKDGWIFRTKTDFDGNFKVNSALRDRFTRMKQAFKAKDMDLVVALIPTRGMMHHTQVDYTQFKADATIASYNKLVAELKDIGIGVGAVDNFKAGQDFFYKRDHHWQAAGAKILAQKVAESVKQLESYKSIEKKKFITEQEGTVTQKGTFTEFANKVCGSDIQHETVPSYKTFAEDAGGEGDLFGDQKSADIVLIGTSNSSQVASKANFDGFLKEYIGADVKNLAVSGGGVDTAMLDWLSSADYKAHKPKIVIWEIPVYQNFKGGPFYRQAIPATYGDCGSDALSTAEADVANNRFEFPSLFEGKNIAAKNHYLYLKFDDFKGRKFRLTTHYTDGSRSPFDFRRSKFFSPDGIFFVEFEQNNDKILKSLEGLMPKDSKGKVTARICAYPQN